MANLKKTHLLVIFLGSMFVWPTASLAHSGRNGSDGCHTNSQTGDRHCHVNKIPRESVNKSGVERGTQTAIGAYNRDSWKHWSDLDKDGRDTRYEMLEDNSKTKVIKDKKGKILRGQWVGVYTGRVLNKTGQVHVDHVVPLSYVSKAGGRSWSNIKKEIFANDKANLVLSFASANISKSDKGPEDWMPVIKSIHCSYLSQWIIVSNKYDISLTQRTKTYIASRTDCQ
jgi:hypothetical protein